jgi:hypothetical protein
MHCSTAPIGGSDFQPAGCAGRVPTDVTTRVEAVYRIELGNSIPVALDDTAYRIEVAYMSAVWLFPSLARRLSVARKRDQTWGIWSIRGRLLWYLEAVGEMTDAASVLQGINKTTQGCLSELRRRWPETTPLGLYPAFATKPQ